MEQTMNEGYIWLSDADSPIIIGKDDLYIDTEGGVSISFSSVYTATVSSNACTLAKNGAEVKIPFIIEAMFVVDGTSYQIKFVDGKYVVYSRPLDTIDTYTEVTYLPNRFAHEIKGLNFRRVWEEKPDPLCEGMSVLVPTVDLFVGFKK